PPPRPRRRRSRSRPRLFPARLDRARRAAAAGRDPKEHRGESGCRHFPQPDRTGTSSTQTPRLIPTGEHFIPRLEVVRCPMVPGALLTAAAVIPVAPPVRGMRRYRFVQTTGGSDATRTLC